MTPTPRGVKNRSRTFVSSGVKGFTTIHAAHAPSGLADLKSRHEEWLRMGEPVDLLSAQEVSTLVGSDVFYGGSLDHRAGTINPMGYCRGLARAAVAVGVTPWKLPMMLAMRVSSGFPVLKMNGKVPTGSGRTFTTPMMTPLALADLQLRFAVTADKSFDPALNRLGHRNRVDILLAAVHIGGSNILAGGHQKRFHPLGLLVFVADHEQARTP